MNLLLLFSNCSLGNSKLNISWRSRTVFILPVVNNFIKKLFTTKSRLLRSALFKWQASTPYSKAAICSANDVSLWLLTYKVLFGIAPRYHGYVGPFNHVADVSGRHSPFLWHQPSRCTIPSDFLRSAAELFRLPPPRSGTHCRTVSSR